jgi:hypothetical protein
MPEIYKASCFPEHRAVPSSQWLIQYATQIGFKLVAEEAPSEGGWLYPTKHAPLIARRWVFTR